MNLPFSLASRTRAARACLLVALMSACTPVMAQPGGFGGGFGSASVPELSMSDALSGRTFPLGLKMSDIVAQADEWRQFNVSNSSQLSVPGGYPEMLLDGALKPFNLFFSQGQAFRSEGQTFLVAYRVPLTQRDFEQISRSSSREGVPLRTVPADTQLSLALLNTATMGNLSNVAAFDKTLITTPVTQAAAAAQASVADAQASVSNLKQIGLALIQYTQDYDEKLPPMNSATQAQFADPSFGKSQNPRTVQERLKPYSVSRKIFLQPRTGAPYRANGIVSGRSLGQIANPAAMVTFYEAAPDASGKRAVLFLDGHVKRINESEWPLLRRASRVSEAPAPQPTVTLSGAAALRYFYLTHQNRPKQTVNGNYYQSKSNGRIYYRDMKTGAFQYVGPPAKPIQVPLATAQRLNLSSYQGYRLSPKGESFGGYSVGDSSKYADAVPATF